MKNFSKVVRHPLFIGGLSVFISTILILLNRLGVVFPNHFEVSQFKIYFYGLIIASAVLLVSQFVEAELVTKYKVSNTSFANALSLIVLAGVIGARLFHIWSYWDYYSADPKLIFLIGDGGLSIFGAIVLPLPILFFFARRWKITLVQLLNTIIFFLPLGQIIGRFGNFFNQELFGLPTDLPWSLKILSVNRPSDYLNHETFHPLFFYEQLLNLILLVLMYFFRKQSVNNADSKLFHAFDPINLFCIGYGTIRMFLEQIRLDPEWLFGLTFGEIFSFGLISIGIMRMVYLLRKKS